jgi:hypothetical protein
MNLPCLRTPIVLAPFVLGSVSVGTLLIYFFGWMPMRQAVVWLLLPSIVLTILLVLWARSKPDAELFQRIAGGCWAGALATLFYDIVRVPIVWSGLPVFKAISYFGTVILDQPAPTLASEAVGWTYHFSNGVGFGLMYAAVVARPRWWTAVAWGLILELAMLRTPYAEVFGYKVTSQFLGITIGAHVVYGLALWLALRHWIGAGTFAAPVPRSTLGLWCGFLVAVLGVGATAVDFHRRYARSIPGSPPGYIGPHLYTTWNVSEPDRFAAMWVLKRFVDPQARFHFVEPFSHIKYGQHFDTPESDTRRTGTEAVTQVLVARSGLANDPRLDLLSRMAHLYEISPWMLPSDRDAQQLGQQLREATERAGIANMEQETEAAMAFLDRWYESAPKPDATPTR